MISSQPIGVWCLLVLAVFDSSEAIGGPHIHVTTGLAPTPFSASGDVDQPVLPFGGTLLRGAKTRGQISPFGGHSLAQQLHTDAADKPTTATTTRRPSKGKSSSGSLTGDMSTRKNYANQWRIHQLFDYLLGPESGYDRNIRPLPECSVFDCTHRIKAWVGVAFTKMLGVDESKNQIKMLGVMTIRWPDYRLDFDASQYMPEDMRWNSSNDYVAIQPHLLWQPDIQLSNAAAPIVKSFHPHAYLYDAKKRHTDGYNVAIQVPVALTVKCNLVLDDFPFDKQTCPFFFRSWSANSKWILFHGIEDPPGVFSSPDWKEAAALGDKNEEFDLKSINMTMAMATSERHGEEQEFAEVVYAVHIERFSHYYMCVIVLPMAMMILFSLGVFFIDPERGERLGFSMTLLLTVMAMSFFTADSLPKSGGGDTWLQKFQAWAYVLTMFPLFVSLSIEMLRRMYLQRQKSRERKGLVNAEEDVGEADFIDWRVDHLFRLPYAICVVLFMAWVCWKYIIHFEQSSLSVEVMLLFSLFLSVGLLAITIFEVVLGYKSGERWHDFSELQQVLKFERRVSDPDHADGTKSTPPTSGAQ